MMAYIILATVSVAGFILLYRKTEEIPFILMAGTVYLKLLFCTFQLIDERFFMVPELILVVWLSFVMRSKEKWIIVIFAILVLFYVYWLLFIQYHIFGLAGFVFMLICMVWYIKRPLKKRRSTKRG